MTDDILTRLSDEADQCRQDGADDVARLLDDAAGDIRKLRAALTLARDRLNDMLAGNDGQAWDEARKAMVRIEAPLAGAPEPSQWRPIETAPRDGRKIILSYLNGNGKRRTVMAKWLTAERAEETDTDGVGLEAGWYECIDNWDDYTEVAIHQGEPSHWQPLPEPPKESQS